MIVKPDKYFIMIVYGFSDCSTVRDIIILSECYVIFTYWYKYCFVLAKEIIIINRGRIKKMKACMVS